jgi:hypothetical protein
VPRLRDLSIWVACSLASRNLPAQLAGDTLAALAQDFIDEVQLLHPNDFLTAADYVRSVPGSRLDDYVAALTAGGPLVPEADDKPVLPPLPPR